MNYILLILQDAGRRENILFVHNLIHQGYVFQIVRETCETQWLSLLLLSLRMVLVRGMCILMGVKRGHRENTINAKTPPFPFYAAVFVLTGIARHGNTSSSAS